MSKKKTIVVVHRKGRRPAEQVGRLESRTNRTDEQRKAYNQLRRQEESLWVPRGAGVQDVLSELEN